MATKPLRPAIYIGTFIHCESLSSSPILEHTAVGVDSAGVIAFVKPLSPDADESERQALAHSQGWTDHNVHLGPGSTVGFWFPGFIDTHIHACQYPNAGIFGKTTLISWLQQYTFPLEASLSSSSKARLVYSRCVRKTLQHGTTTAAYYATSSVSSTTLLAQECLARGQRAFVGRCNMDTDLQPEWYRDASAAEALAATGASIDEITALDPERSLVSPIVTPRFAPSCSSELLTGLGHIAEARDLPVQTHISENLDEVALVARMFPAQKSYAETYDAHGLLGPKTVLAHACHLGAGETALLKERRCAVSHCPASNSYLGSGLCPVRELLDADITVGLGTDVSGGYSPSILAAAKEAGGVSRIRTAVVPEGTSQMDKDRLKLTVEETLFLATRGGARCLGLQDRVGAFVPGMEWDAQFVDLGAVVGGKGAAETAADGADEKEGGRGNVEIYEGMGWEERLAKWVFCGDDRNTRAVWVKGRLVSGSM